MDRKKELAFILVFVLTISSMVCHMTLRALGMRYRAGSIDRTYYNLAVPSCTRTVAVLGSSLPFYGLSFSRISESLNRPVKTRIVASGSVCEIEQILSEISDATTIILSISLYDSNENNIADGRAMFVPLHTTISDLWHSCSTWPFSKKALSMYAQDATRIIFPTVGRSIEIMNAIRDRVGIFKHAVISEETTARPNQRAEKGIERIEKITDWDQGRLLRNLSTIRASGRADHTFDGPKSLALKRVLRWCGSGRELFIAVLPVSPYYRDAFISEGTKKNFENLIKSVHQINPTINIIRLDQELSLDQSIYFWDLVHLNESGRKIATKLLLNHMLYR